MVKYVAVLLKEDTPGYGVVFPDFPGCVSAGDDMAEAACMAEEALALHIRGMVADNEPLPAPSSLDAVRLGEWADDDAAYLLVEAPAEADRMERINISVRQSDLHAIDAAAEARHMTRSAYMVSRALERDRPAAGRSARQRTRT